MLRLACCRVGHVAVQAWLLIDHPFGEAELGKAPVRRLKVYQAHLGFYDTVVAASSQAAALRAWGVHQNLFSTGLAKVTDDPQVVEAARAHPGIPLKRAAGSTDPLVLEPAHLLVVPEGPEQGSRTGKAQTSPPSTPARLPPDRSLIDAAEAEIRKLDERHARQEADLRRRQEELEADRAAAHATYVADRKAATAAVVSARQMYREAGGKD